MQYGHPERKQIKRSYDPQVHTWTNSMMFQFKQSPRGVRSRASWPGCVVLPILFLLPSLPQGGLPELCAIAPEGQVPPLATPAFPSPGMKLPGAFLFLGSGV